MSKIRVAFFADMLTKDFDGCIRTIQQIVTRIPHEEFEFRFFTGVPPEDEKGLSYIKLPTVDLFFNKPYVMVLPFLRKRKIKAQLQEFDPHIIHVSNPSILGQFGANYANRRSIPLSTIYHTHYVTYVKYYLRFFKALIPLVEKRVIAMTKGIYDKCDLVYLPVPKIQEDFKSMDFRIDNCKIWPRGIDNQLFNPSKKDEQYFKRLTGNANPNILFASRLVWEKNLQTLIDIYELTNEEDRKYNFIVVGDGAAKKALKEKMPKAYFLGNLTHEQLSTVYASSDVFVFPSDTETYGNVIVEAMASGLPSIAANNGGPTGIISNGENGFLCESHSAKNYLEKIELIVTNAELKERLVSNGLKMTKDLSWNKLAKLYFQDLKSLVNKN